jgi:uncharacterized protein (TIGR00255 family)
MRGTQRHVQESERIDEWMWLRGETGEQRATRELCSTRAIGVPTHAIKSRDQRHVWIDGGGEAILILFPRADQADLGIFDLQNQPPGRSAKLLRNYCIARPRAVGLSMIVSMTGFARAEAQLPAAVLVCELRSVNHRYLEPTLRLPEELRALDPELRALLQKELRRGKVDCIFTYRAAAQAAQGLEIDAAVLGRLAPLLNELAAATLRSGAAQQLNLIDLLRYPGVLREAAIDSDAVLEAARRLFATVLADLKSMRAREGGRLQELVLQRCEQLAGHVAQVRARLPEVHAAIRTRFAERLADLAISIDAERLEQEVALVLQRMDVAEELDRLDGHIVETRKIVASPEAAGRRLDFLMQEFNREANTLSSKSQDLATTRLAVDMKVLIEQMREQVQNIE